MSHGQSLCLFMICDVNLLLHGTAGSIYELLVLFLLIGGNCEKSVKPMMQTMYT